MKVRLKMPAVRVPVQVTAWVAHVRSVPVRPSVQ